MVIFILCLRDDFHLLNDEFNKLMLFFQKRSEILQPKRIYMSYEFIVNYLFSPRVQKSLGY